MAELDEGFKSTEVHATGTDKFRRVAIIGTLVCSCISVLLLAVDSRSCDLVPLEYGIYICAGVHLLTFSMLLASYMCPSAVNKVGRCMVIFYFMIVGAMVTVQFFFFKGKGCGQVAPIMYYWILTNILCFYVLVAYGLSLWGAYICWEVDEEEKLI